MTYRANRTLAIAAIALSLFSALPAAADPDEAKLEEAKKAYEEGAEAFTTGDFATAVAKLGRSFDLVPSPNAELVLARALRETGNHAEAARHFTACEATSRERVAKGDDRFKETITDCGNEGTTARAKVAKLVATVPAAKPGTTVEFEGKSMQLVNGSTDAVFHEPGSVTLTVKPPPPDASYSKTVTLEAGKDATITLEPPPPPPPPEPKSAGRRKWAIPAGIASGGVAVIGLGLFIGFGAKSESIYGDFDACAPHCPATTDFNQKAQDGATAQNVANASLTITVIAAAASGTFFVLAFTDKSSHGDAAPAPATALNIGPTGFSVRRSF